MFKITKEINLHPWKESKQWLIFYLHPKNVSCFLLLLSNKIKYNINLLNIVYISMDEINKKKIYTYKR
jgi:hypothetical protein